MASLGLGGCGGGGARLEGAVCYYRLEPSELPARRNRRKTRTAARLCVGRLGRDLAEPHLRARRALDRRTPTGHELATELSRALLSTARYISLCFGCRHRRRLFNIVPLLLLSQAHLVGSTHLSAHYKYENIALERRASSVCSSCKRRRRRRRRSCRCRRTNEPKSRLSQ